MSTSHFTRRGVIGAGVGVGAVGALSACGDSSTPSGPKAPAASGDGGAEGYDGPAVTLQYWNGLTGGDGPIMKKLVAKFMTENKNIKVVTTAIAWADFFQKLPAAVSNGKGPEVALMHVSDIPTMAARRVIQPLDDVIKALKLTKEDFPATAWDATIVNDVQYAMCLDLHPAGLFYNKTVLEKVGLDPEKPPTTKDEFMSILDTCKSKGVQGYWTSALSVGGLVAQSVIFQNGGYMEDETGTKTGFGDQAAIDAITFFKSLIDQGYSPKNAAGDADWVSFQNDKAAFMINGPWMVTPCKEITKLKWGAAPMPFLGTKTAEKTWGGSHCFTLPVQRTQDANKQKASRVFLNWMGNNSVDWAEAGMVPARASVRESEGFKKYKEVVEFEKMANWIQFPPLKPGVADAETSWTPAVSNAMLGKKPIDVALKEAAATGDKVLEANKKKYGY